LLPLARAMNIRGAPWVGSVRRWLAIRGNKARHFLIRLANVSHNFDTAPGPFWSHNGPPLDGLLVTKMELLKWFGAEEKRSSRCCRNDCSEVTSHLQSETNKMIKLKDTYLRGKARLGATKTCQDWIFQLHQVMMGRLDQVQHFPFFQVEFLIEISNLTEHFLCDLFHVVSISNQPKNALSCPVSRACWWTRSEDRQETGSFWERLAAQMVQESFLVGHYLVKRFKTWVVEEFVTWSAYYFTKLVNNT
jgi:hypothetical protein